MSQPPTAPDRGSSSRSSSLVRSKSLRLPQARRSDHSPSNSLTRHGSMRLPRPSTSSNSISSVANSNIPSKKPAPPPIKPKPSFIDRIGEKVHNTLSKSTKSTLSVQDSTSSNKPSSCLSRTGSPKSERDHSATRTVIIDAPTSAREQAVVERDKNAAISREMGMSPDVVQHFRRLTEEHDKLQMEYARLRMLQMDNATSKLLSASTQNLHKDLNNLHTAFSDTHLDTIPEDGPTIRIRFNEDKQYDDDYIHHLESLVHGYRAEILRVQDEARKMQRRYWEQVMNSDDVDFKAESGKQVLELLSKQEERQKEVAELSKKIQDVQSQLSSCNQELQKCHNALQDYQYQIDSGEHERAVLERKLKDAKSDLAEAKESLEFLQAERSTLAESLLEVEQNLATTKLQLEKETATVRDLSQRNRKLYSKLQEKNLQLQLLHADLESTQGRARDMLLSQGAQLTMGAVAISQLSSRVHSLLSSTLEYAATELGLEKEVHYEINIDEFDDLDDEHLSPVFDMSSSSSHEKLSKSNGLLNGKGGSPNTEDCLSPLDLENVQGKSTSLVQSIIQALEQSNKEKAAAAAASASNPGSPTKNPKSDTSENGDTASQDGKSKPVGTATAFRNEDQDKKSEDGDSKKSSSVLNGDLGIPHHLKSPRDDEASLEGQAKHANMMLNKLVNVLGMVQKKYSLEMADMDKDISKLKVEMDLIRKEKVHLELDVKKKTNLIEDLVRKLDEAQKELSRERGRQESEVNALQDEIQEIKTKCAALQAMNNEQALQLKEEVGKLVRSTGPSNPMIDAMAICDKLVLKQEIVRLKELLKEKDDVLKRLAAKFTRHKKVWEENYQKAEAEVNKLDDVIEKVVQILESVPELVKSSEPLSNLLEKLKSGTLFGDNSKEAEASAATTSSNDGNKSDHTTTKVDTV